MRDRSRRVLHRFPSERIIGIRVAQRETIPNNFYYLLLLHMRNTIQVKDAESLTMKESIYLKQ